MAQRAVVQRARVGRLEAQRGYKVTNLRDRWQKALAKHSWPLDKEVKWHGARTGEVPPALGYAEARFWGTAYALDTSADASQP